MDLTMYQAKVRFLATGREMRQDWDTRERAVSALVGLLRASGYDHTAEEIRAELSAPGAVVHYGTRDYWVEETA